MEWTVPKDFPDLTSLNSGEQYTEGDSVTIELFNLLTEAAIFITEET